mmetsp:Transcript_7138/g.10444  ORF Transcript_7138/g.10444 Transcript_7138/m.10444 type:complete len:861 (-) Transcript_7138:237-2819(-)
MGLTETMDKREKKKKRSSRGKKGGYLPGMYSPFENGQSNSSRRRSKSKLSDKTGEESEALTKSPSIVPSVATSTSHHSYTSRVSQVSIHTTNPVLEVEDPLMKDIESQILRNPSMQRADRSTPPEIKIEQAEVNGDEFMSANAPTTPSTTTSTLSGNTVFSDNDDKEAALPKQEMQEQPEIEKEGLSGGFVANFDTRTESSSSSPRPAIQPRSVSFSVNTKTSKTTSSEPHWIGMAQSKSQEWITTTKAEEEYAGGDRPTRMVVFSKGGDGDYDDRSHGGLTTLTNRTEEFDKAKRRCMIYGIVFLSLLTIVGAVIGISIGTKGRGDGDDDVTIDLTTEPTVMPTAPTPTVQPEPSIAPSGRPTSSDEYKERLDEVHDLIELRAPDSFLSLDDPSSPQALAALWVAEWLGSVSVRPSPGEILQKYAVLTLYYGTGGDGIWTRSDLWAIQEVSECEWENIECDWGDDPDQEYLPIVSLSLFANEMIGTIPEEVLLLTSLEVFDVAANKLEGSISPRFFTELTNLSVFITGGNEMTGRIPTEVGMATNLKFLRLYGNILSGPIPSEIGILTHLVELELNENRISGQIPDVFWFLTDLKSLRLDNNNFQSSSLPTSFGGMLNISRLTLEGNNLVGGLDHVMWEGMTRLDSLQLAKCNFVGTVPPSLGTLSGLTRLNLAGNELVGTIPISLSELPLMKEMFLAANKLTGTLPTQFGLAKNLSVIAWSDNILQGTIPTEYGSLPELKALVLSSNELTGTMPSELGLATQLEYINMYDNQFVGELPSVWANARDLVAIDIANNTLQGTIPPEWFDLEDLIGLFLGGNPDVTGSIPSHFCPNVEELTVPCAVEGCNDDCNCTCYDDR